MNFRPRRPEPPAVDLTPLIDVVFLLLIFFMVSTSFERRVELPLRLPRVHAPPPSASASVHLRIDRHCCVSWEPAPSRPCPLMLAGCSEAVPTAARDLTAVLSAARGTAVAVAIEADAQTPHGAVVQALAAARAAGFERVGFAAVAPGNARPAADQP